MDLAYYLQWGCTDGHDPYRCTSPPDNVDYDNVLVLDRGHALEFGLPAELLDNHASAFCPLCERSGELDNLWDSVKPLRHDTPIDNVHG